MNKLASGIGVAVIGLGLFLSARHSSEPSQKFVEINEAEARCLIKGNINSSRERIYHEPGDQFYDATEVDESVGEEWFCSREEAETAGWRKAKR